MQSCGRWLTTHLANIKFLLKVPAVGALLIQLGAFLAVILIDRLSTHLWGIEFSLGIAVITQGAIAACASFWLGLALWWWIIQLFFPVALIATQLLQIPSYFFLLLLGVSIGFFWNTFRTQVPFYPSHAPTWDAVEKLLPADCTIRFVDIGSGLGGLVVHLAKQKPESSFTGIEIAPLSWVVSLLYSRIVSSNCKFIRGDYLHLDFSHFDVVFAYLSPAAMQALWHKAKSEMRPGSLLISYEFSIHEIPPHFVSKPDERGATLYAWRL